MVFARRLRGSPPSGESGEFCGRSKHEFAVYVTNLPTAYNAWQIQQFNQPTDAHATS